MGGSTVMTVYKIFKKYKEVWQDRLYHRYYYRYVTGIGNRSREQYMPY